MGKKSRRCCCELEDREAVPLGFLRVADIGSRGYIVMDVGQAKKREI